MVRLYHVEGCGVTYQMKRREESRRYTQVKVIKGVAKHVKSRCG